MRLKTLVGLWAARDARYGVRRAHGFPNPLTEREVDAIRVWRLREAGDLPDTDDANAALARVAAWQPPRLGGGT